MEITVTLINDRTGSGSLPDLEKYRQPCRIQGAMNLVIHGMKFHNCIYEYSDRIAVSVGASTGRVQIVGGNFQPDSASMDKGLR